MNDERTVYLHEDWVEETLDGKRYGLGDTGEPYEAFTDNIGRLFRSLQCEYGAASKMYIDTKGGDTFQCGWVFRKKRAYEDDPKKFYIAETLVSVYEQIENGGFTLRNLSKK